jgi:hypothetical protein
MALGSMPKCPGMDPNFWKHSDIRENRCPHCGSPVEFWKDDVKRLCPTCNKILFNPNLDTSCLAWCQGAAECLGNMDIEEWRKTRKTEGNGQ